MGDTSQVDGASAYRLSRYPASTILKQGALGFVAEAHSLSVGVESFEGRA
jgi:hypothetical protein